MPNAALLDMQRIVRLAAEPRAPDDSAKAAIGRAARRLSLGYRRCYSFWYARDEAIPRADEVDQARAAELHIIARERIRLQTRMDWIQARLNARESGAHGAVAALVGAQDGTRTAEAGARADGTGGMVGAEGLIADVRQLGWVL